MAKRKKSASDGAAGADPLSKLAGVVAILAMKDTPPEDAALRLRTLGFTATEIGGILGVTGNYVRVVASVARKAKAKS